MKDKVTNIDLSALKKKLSWGDYTKIGLKVKRTLKGQEKHLSYQAVSNQLSGISKIKPEVINAALELLEEREKIASKLNKRINK